MKCTGQLIDTIENAELRQGYMAQMLDEVRHVNQETYLDSLLRAPRGRPRGLRAGLQVPRHQHVQPRGPRRARGILRRRSDRGGAQPAGRRRDGLYEPDLRRPDRGGRRERRSGDAERLPEHPVGRGATHGERLLDARRGRVESRQPAVPPTRLRPRVLAPARFPRSLPRHGLRLLPDPALLELHREVERVDPRGLGRLLHREARALRSQGARAGTHKRASG